jgi:fatty-acyl-CoA synthase
MEAGGVSDQALTPLSFLLRSAEVWADRPAVQDGGRVWTYAEHLERIERLKGTLTREWAVTPGDRVATLLPNLAPMLELHYAVPGSGAVLVPMNTRLSSGDYEYIVAHSGASLVVADESFRAVLDPAMNALGTRAPRVVWTEDWDEAVESGPPVGLDRVSDERSLLAINYTSGTTARPKGVMTTHRGAYLHSLGVIAEAGLDVRSAYLWTLPMFHCNGWAYTWAVTAAGAKHVCLRQLDPELAWRALTADGVTHMCAAPTVVVMLLEARQAGRLAAPVALFVGGAPPAPALLERAAALNIDVTHLYGLTETYGPIAVCAWDPEWDDLAAGEQARMRSRQGVPTVVSEKIRVVGEDMTDVPADGESVGEIVMRGNNVMLGYYRDPEATAQAFRGGWFHSGDAGVMHPDGRIELKDRLKDVIISGGENISSVEVEQVLASHPSVAEAAVIAVPDSKWGEVVGAFVVPRSGTAVDREEVVTFARSRLAHFKVPKQIYVVDELPKTGTGKIQKFVLRQQLSDAGRQI